MRPEEVVGVSADPNVEPLFHLLSRLTSIHLGYITHASGFTAMFPNGLLPRLEWAQWIVDPVGFEALMDVIEDRSMNQPPLPRLPRAMIILCHNGPQFKAAWSRYSELSSSLQGMGFDIEAEDERGNPIGEFIDRGSNYVDSEDSDEDSDRDDDWGHLWW